MPRSLFVPVELTSGSGGRHEGAPGAAAALAARIPSPEAQPPQDSPQDLLCPVVEKILHVQK